jgi:hypothetical protein
VEYKYVMGKVFCLVIIGCVAAQGTLASATEQPQRTIPCGEIIKATQFPYPQRRLVLGAVSVPSAYLVRSYPTLETPWRYFAKQGMVVKSGTLVTHGSARVAEAGRDLVGQQRPPCLSHDPNSGL